MSANAELIQAIAQAETQQMELAKRVIARDEPPFNGLLVTGIDVAYTDTEALGCAVVMNLHNQAVVQIVKRTCECRTPYLPGFLQLREGPIVASILGELEPTGPVLINGNGVLHPRRLGLASYLGVTMDRQTVGVTKTLLQGEIQARSGDTAEVVDAGQTVGSALWLNGKKKPVFVSIGHRVSLETALDVVRKTSIHGFPEPLRRAHSIAKSWVQTLHGGSAC
ncbi:MAG: hypothetical protein C4K49_07265 [Candidatus Thorarchaeota archaeon]|nr:MAG: hypothetical protein C4K49_07265 [Candidatus Thorarchaeota archaeon]